MRATSHEPRILTNRGFPRIFTNRGFPRIFTNRGFPQIFANRRFPQIFTNRRFPQIFANRGFPQILTNRGLPRIFTNRGFPQIFTNRGFPQIFTNRGIPRIAHQPRIARTLAVIIVVIPVLAAAGGHAQEPQSILPALLGEVKGLRAAMEQMASAGPRVQLALGRLQLQEQRINTLTARLQTVRDRMSSLQRQAAQQQTHLERVEAAASKSNPGERAEVEDMLAVFKFEIAASTAEIQRLTVEEATIASDIATEQARWTDINQRLEELERALARR